jgi:hypothetical protein
MDVMSNQETRNTLPSSRTNTKNPRGKPNKLKKRIYLTHRLPVCTVCLSVFLHPTPWTETYPSSSFIHSFIHSFGTDQEVRFEASERLDHANSSAIAMAIASVCGWGESESESESESENREIFFLSFFSTLTHGHGHIHHPSTGPPPLPSQ